MRILFDYRPALRRRTGVGEYVHETAKALVASAPADERLTLFSSSWRDRLAPESLPGTEVVDRRLPVRLLHLLWHRRLAGVPVLFWHQAWADSIELHHADAEGRTKTPVPHNYFNRAMSLTARPKVVSASPAIVALS